MSFVVYDVAFLVLFVIFIAIFLRKNKKNLKREGLLYLYKTSWGIKLIDRVGKKYNKTLKFLSYISIALGYVLMIGILYLFGRIIYIYLFQQAVVQAIKVPPITPLVPYLPQAFGLDFLPPFYFTYWILIIAIIAITHEFAHGIFAARDNIKIKTTGFGFFPFFLPVFLAAFVEPDEKQIQKKSIFSQLSVLSAGTFANVLTGIFFMIILILFFTLAFAPAGITFDTYVTSSVAVSGISIINNTMLNNPSYQELIQNTNEKGFTEIKVNNQNYLVTKSLLEQQKNSNEILVYDSAPAIKANLSGAISEIDNEKVTSIEELSMILSEKSPGEKITVQTKISDDETKNYEIILAEHPNNPEKAWLGIGFYDRAQTGAFGKIISWLTSFKNPNVYYQPKIDGLSIFIYNLLWWIVLISFSVALINMLPMGIFDGGRFFYLTILGITKNKKIAKQAFVFITQFLLFLILFMMILWAFSVF